MKKLNLLSFLILLVSGVSFAQYGTRIRAYDSGVVDVMKPIKNKNNAIGFYALDNIETIDPTNPNQALGYENNAFGLWSMQFQNLGFRNNGFGTGTLRNGKTGSFNNAFGYYALANNSVDYNNGFGGWTLSSNTTGIGNNAFGFQAMIFNKTGHYNIAFGHQSSYKNDSGSYNISIGKDALNTNTIGSYNTVLGTESGSLITGNFNTIIGSQIKGTSGMNNHVIIGDGAGNQRIFINDLGNMAIGTTSPIAKLTIEPGANPVSKISGKDIYFGALLKTTSGRSGYTVLNSNDYLNGLENNAHFGSIFPFEDSNSNNDLKWKAFRLQTGTSLVDKFWVNKLGDGYYAGKVLIGTDIKPTTAGGVSVANYNLFVTGGILTEEVRVQLKANGGWADYVFNKDYNLKPLSEVESFINKNGHLPNIPSAKQVAEEGIELGQMTTLQQEKIEELTLYLIQQQKEIEELKAMVKDLASKK